MIAKLGLSGKELRARLAKMLANYFRQMFHVSRFKPIQKSVESKVFIN